MPAPFVRNFRSACLFTGALRDLFHDASLDDAPESAVRGVLHTRRAALLQAHKETLQSLGRIGFLPESHPAIFALRSAYNSIGEELDAIEYVLSSDGTVIAPR